MTLDEFLSRLQGVKRRGENKFIACCPAHDDKDPSLSLTERDGKILLHCWSGCSALSVVESLGLTLGDLFLERDYSPPMAFAQREFSARRKREKALEAARLVVALAESDRKAGKRQSLQDRKRELEAVKVLALAGVEYDPEIVLMGIQ